jgi:hypothetical protein
MLHLRNKWLEITGIRANIPRIGFGGGSECLSTTSPIGGMGERNDYMSAIRRLDGFVLCGALLILTLPAARAQEEATDWKAKCSELEEKVRVLEEDLDDQKSRADYYRDILSKDRPLGICPRFNVRSLVEVDFRQASLQDVADTLNRHIQSTGTNDIENAIASRQTRIQELEAEIEKLREASRRTPIREVRLAMPEGMHASSDRLVTFSAMDDITLAEALEYATDIAGVTYQIEGDVVWIMPKRHLLIRHDELNVDAIKQRLDSLAEPSVLLFTDAGLKKAIEKGFVNERREKKRSDDFIFIGGTPAETMVHYISPSGIQRFGYLMAPRETGEIPPGDPFGFTLLNPAASELDEQAKPQISELSVATKVSDVRLLRASVDTNTFTLVFRDYESNEPVQVEIGAIDLYTSQGDEISSFTIPAFSHTGWDYPASEVGIYLHYRLGMQGIRPEDQNYFHAFSQYRLGRIFENQFGYLLRIP